MHVFLPGESGIQQNNRAFPRQALDGYKEKNRMGPVSL